MAKRLTEEQLKAIKYLNPNTNTHFSIPLGFGSVKAHLKRAAECGFTGFAITDYTVMGGVLEAYKLSRDKDYLSKTLKKESFPIIIGAKVNIIDDLAKKDKVNKFFPLTIYAKDATGYKNLVTLVSIASDDEHFFMKPRVSLPELIEYGEGLVVTSGDINGMIAQSILKETEQEELLIEIFKEHFGDNFFIEMHYHDRRMQWDKNVKEYVDSGNDPQKVVNLRLMELAKKHKVKCLLTQNSSMPKKQNFLQQKIMIANNPAFKDGWKPYQAYYTMSVEEMYEDVQQNAPYITDEQFVEWCNNTQLLLDKCKDIKLSFTPKLPTIVFSEALVNKESEWEIKYQDMKNQLKDRHPNLYELFEVGESDISLKTSLKIMIRNNKVNFNDKVSCDRLTEELKVIQRNGIIQLCDYFLLLEDVTHFVRENGYLRGFGRGCLTGDTKVLTTNGFKNLNNIKTGEKVFTHTGQSKKVIKTFEYDINEKIATVETQSSWGQIQLTPDHKVYGVKRTSTKEFGYNDKTPGKRKKYNDIEHNPQFYPIEQLNEGDLLFVSKPKYKAKKFTNIDLVNYIDKNLNEFDENLIYNINPLTKKRQEKFNRHIIFDDNLIYLLGKWIGNGWYCYKPEKRKYYIGYAFNSNDTKEIDKTINFFEKMNFTVKKIPHKTKNLVQVVIYNKVLTKWFKSFFQNYKCSSSTKYIGDLVNLDEQYLKILMLGLQSADGLISTSNRQESFCTTSPQLVKDIKECLLKLAIPCNITTRKAYYRGKYLCKESYTIKFIGLNLNQKLHNHLITNDGYYVKIKNITIKKQKTKVYDLMIEDNPSYLTSNFTVHNSGAGSLVAYALDITDCDPLAFDLLFERFLTKERIGKLNFEIEGFDFNLLSKE